MRCGDDKQAGFTLIELLAVLVIISLMTAVVVLSLPREKPVIETQGHMLARQLETAAQASVITGVSQGFGVYEDGYVFYSFVDGEWAVESETLWPDDISVRFYKEDVRLDLPEEPSPVVIFEPLGLSTNFGLRIEANDQVLMFSSKGDGKVMLEKSS